MTHGNLHGAPITSSLIPRDINRNEKEAEMSDCDPRHHLQYDYRAVSLTNELAYAFFQDIDSQTSEEIQKTAGATFYIEGVPVGLNYDDAKSLTAHYASTTGTTLNRKQAMTIVEQRLSDGGVQAYIACLRGASPLIVRVTEAAADWNSVTFIVSWEPKSVSAVGDLRLQLDGGTFADGSTQIVRSKWARQSSEAFRVMRADNRSISLIAEIDGQAASREVPIADIMRRPVIKQREVEMPILYRGGWYGHDAVEREVQIVAEPGTVLLPSTARCLVEKSYGRPDSVPVDLVAEVTAAGPNGAVFRYHNWHGWNPGVSYIVGKGVVLQYDPNQHIAAVDA